MVNKYRFSVKFAELAYLLLVIKAHTSQIVKFSKKGIEQEELEFNGRWCDDGGRNVE